MKRLITYFKSLVVFKPISITREEIAWRRAKREF